MPPEPNKNADKPAAKEEKEESFSTQEGGMRNFWYSIIQVNDFFYSLEQSNFPRLLSFSDGMPLPTNSGGRSAFGVS